MLEPQPNRYDKFKKVNGIYKSRILSPVKKIEKMITQHNKISEIFEDLYTKISRDPHIENNSSKYIRRKKAILQ